MARRLRVLVADDHEAHRRLLDDLFSAMGCSVTTVCNGEAAVDTAGDFDLICLDRHMPGMGGEAAARRLYGKAYLVACTSHPEGLGAHFNAVLSKPFCCCELAELVEAARKWRPHRTGRSQGKNDSAALAADCAVAKVACSR